jgi:exopolysaccharide biosynthesis polyprenyl glycosylphosphotransferase
MSSEFGIGGLKVGLRRLAVLLPQLVGAIAAAAILAQNSTVESGIIALVAYVIAGFYSLRAAHWRWLLPLAGLVSAAAMPVLGTVFTVAGYLFSHEHIAFGRLAIAALVALEAVILGSRFVAPAVRARVGLIGTPREAIRLREELSKDPFGGGFVVSATITPDDWIPDADAMKAPYLCSLSEIGRTIDERDLEILVITSAYPRARIHERLYREVITRPLEVIDLPEFHERRFGSVPLAEIDPGWFTRLAGRHYRPLGSFAKRSFDVAVSLPALIFFAPLVAFFSVLIRRDGGPALFRQERVGLGGEPFRIYKLRTMTHDPARENEWTDPNDLRVTRLGKFLRRSHLDEAPQLWNIVRGDMSLVGPRPEQLPYVEMLSEQIPFYGQRHLVKPGLTGWAQVRVGYAGSFEGTALKLCNDLYYVKHHSLSLDLTILFETFRTLVADRQYGELPSTVATMLGEGDSALFSAQPVPAEQPALGRSD